MTAGDPTADICCNDPNGRVWPKDEPAIAGVVLAAAACFRHRVTRMD